MPKEEKLQKFVEHLADEANTLAVILFGSHARGNSRPDSDIDLIVIVNEGDKRAAEYFEDQAFEITYSTEQGAMEFWKSHPHDAVGLWVVAKVLFDRDGTGERLRSFGVQLCEEDPPEVSQSTVDHLRFDFEDSLNAVEKIRGNDPATASLLLHRKVAKLIDLYFDLQKSWRPAPKQQLEQLETQNSELGKLFRDFYTSENLEKKMMTAKSIGRHIFE